MASDGSNPPVPTRKERKLCHAKRDEYYACLDKHSIDDPATAGTLCQDLRKLMFEKCPESWATYFEQLRAMEKQKEKAYQRASSARKVQ
ncbi:hypothetical protein GGI12_002783 [Dipsacomyces acuminosporus]|nr:hypothetical protein GGI12_002783 [Dipsacomyces acuminosporus]